MWKESSLTAVSMNPKGRGEAEENKPQAHLSISWPPPRQSVNNPKAHFSAYSESVTVLL